MGKRLSIFITVLLIAGIAAGWYFFAKESRYLGTSPLKAVPAESPFFIRIRNLGDFADKTVKNSSWQSLVNIREIADIYRDFVVVDSLVLQNKENENLLRRKELIVVPADSSMLYLLEIGSLTEKNRINSLIKDYFQSKNIVATENEFKNTPIQQYEWVKKGEKKRLLVAFQRGVLLIGNGPLQLQLAIEQMDKPSVPDDPGYLQVNKNSSENIDLNIFINHKTFPAYLSRFYADSLATGMLLPNYAKWTEVDVIQKENQLLANGFTVADTSATCYLDVFKHQNPLSGSLIQLMPATTTFFVAQNLSHPEQYFEDYDSYLRKAGKLSGYQDQLSNLSKELNLEVGQYLNERWTGEAASVFTNPNLEDKSDDRFLLIKVKTDTNDPLVSAIKKWSSARKNKLKDLELTEAERNNIWKVPCENFGDLIGELYFGSIKTAWITTAGDGLILMGATPGSLKRYLELLRRNELLQNNPSYTKFATGLARTSNFYMWCSPGHSLPFFEQSIQPAKYPPLKNAVSSLKKVENIAWQWGYENGRGFNTVSMLVNPAANQDLVPFWRYPLKAKLRNKPAFVTYSTKNQDKELVFQDTENNLIDLDKDGIEKWKIKLDGALMGDVKLIDFRKNGEFQLLFNTRDAIYLIDRNGNRMKNFPVRLRSGATNEISVFDYDGKKDYRFLIACRDHKVYNFDKNGKPVVGWQPKATGDFVEFPIHHFRVGPKDYIVFFDRKCTYILDRQGKERVKIKDEFVHSKNDISLITAKGIHTSLVTTDDHGKIRLLGFDGSSKIITVGNFSKSHFFLPFDVDGDGSADYLFVDKQTLSLYGFSGNLIFSHPLPYSIDQVPVILSFGNDKIMELTSFAEKRTILVRKDGSIFDKFLPDKFLLPAVGSFDGRSDILNWLVAEPEGFLSNYQMLITNEK